MKEFGLRTFLVIGRTTAGYGVIDAALRQHYPISFRMLREGIWLVRSSDATTKDVSDRLGFTPDGAGGSGLVTGMNGYFGRWEPDLWEWLNASQAVGGG